MKKIIKKFFNLVGINIQKFSPYIDTFYIRNHLINDLKIQNVIDVGANTGQYATEIFNKGYTGNIYSFEPIGNTFKALNENAKKNSKWKVFHYALSNSSGNQEMYSVRLSPESSLLKSKREYTDAKKEMVTLITFDEWIRSENLSLENYWLKIDVEGYEKFVLEGAKENISKAAIVELELSPLPRFEYEDASYESTVTNIITYMKKYNFDVVHIDNPAHYDIKKPYLCYLDIIFIRNELKYLLKNLY